MHNWGPKSCRQAEERKWFNEKYAKVSEKLRDAWAELADASADVKFARIELARLGITVQVPDSVRNAIRSGG